MADVGGQEDIATVDLMASSSLMEALCVVPIDAVVGSHGCHGEDENHITQVGYLFRSSRFFIYVFVVDS